MDWTLGSGQRHSTVAEVIVDLSDLSQLADTISRHVTDVRLEGGLKPALLVLLRSSGDERAEQLRMATLRDCGERLASLAGWTGDPGTEDLLLRAQLVLATAIGMVILRSQPRIEPLASATSEELNGPLGGLVSALFAAGQDVHQTGAGTESRARNQVSKPRQEVHPRLDKADDQHSKR